MLPTRSCGIDIAKSNIESCTPLTLPLVAPPLPDIAGLYSGRGLVVVCRVAQDPEKCRAVEDDKGELRQNDVMDLHEELLPHARIHCRQFLFKEGIQGRIAVEVPVASLWRELVARQYRRIVGVISRVLSELGDVIPAGHSSRGRRCLPPVQERSEYATRIVLDVELDAERLQVALDDRFNRDAVWIGCDYR